MATTRALRRFDWPTAVANLAFLFPVCLIPFVSAWVGQAVTTPRAWAAYSLVMIGCSATNICLVLVQSRGGGRLMGGVTPRERLYRVGRAASPGIAWSIGLAGTVAGQPRVAMVCWLLIPVLTRLCAIFLKPKPAAAGAEEEAEAA
jgi:TMEM175 potassium channel family protein